MRLARIELSNWMCYAGDQSIDVDGGTYAIVAKSSQDGRSNWLGKSTLVRAIAFALYGDHPFGTEDEWITNGADAGGVRLVFDDGFTVHRWRKRGGRSWSLTTSSGAMKDAAQDEIVERLGLSLKDFKASAYFEQRCIAQLVIARPGERMKIVAGWLRLDRIEAAAKSASADLRSVLEEQRRVIGEKTAVEARRFAVAAKLAEAGADMEPVPAVDPRVKAARDAYAEAENAARGLQHRRREHADRKAAFDDTVARGRATVERHREAVAKLEAAGAVDAERLDALKAEHVRAVAEVGRWKPIAKGDWDGQCAVMCETCPVEHDVRTKTSAAVHQLGLARARVSELAPEITALKDAQHEIESINRRVVGFEGELRELRARAQQQKAALAESPPVDESELAAATARLDACRETLDAVMASDVRMEIQARNERRRVWQEDLDRIDAEVADLEARLAVVNDRLTVLRACVLTLGRQGAQAAIAERALQAIEDSANDLLASAGIDLTLRVRWQREGTELASECDACGAPFGSSRKVKTCPTCGADRGLQMSDRLDLVLSSVSGAAEDLAGVAFQLAAASWLRAQRGIRFGVAILDEPFGALDTYNRRALSSALPAMLTRAGFSQAFVIAHTSDTVSALSRQIEIRNEGGHATLRAAW